MTIYPTKQPEGKHDLLYKEWPLPPSLEDNQFSSLEELKRKAIEKHSYRDKKLICTLYTYSDAPKKPILVNPLVMIGFISQDYKDLDWSHFSKCDVAVKLSCGKYRSQIPKKDVVKSDNFRILFQTLRETNCAAVIACDKYKRVLFLQPHEDKSIDENIPEKDYYAAVCYYGKFDLLQTKIKTEIQSMNDWIPSSPLYPPPEGDPNANSSPIWKPDNDVNEWKPTTPLYPPPDTEDPNANTSPPWRPSHDTLTNNAMEIDNDGPQWKPETPTMDEDGGANFEPETSIFQQPTDNSNDDGLWKPPGEDTNDDSMLWQPPTSTDGDSSMPSFSTPLFDNPNTVSETSNTSNNDNDNENNNTFHSNEGAAAADAFYSGLTRQLDTRADSWLFHMRAFNGWVKATQIAELNPRTNTQSNPSSKKRARTNNTNTPLNVLDLACGKGGDLGKWVLHRRGMGKYVGVDVARGSLVDAAKRAKKLGLSKKLSNASFICADLGEDVPSRPSDKLLTWIMDLEKEGEWMDPKFEVLPGGGVSKHVDQFDVVSIQFAIHYMMQTRKRARRFFKTVSDLLKIGGNLIATTVDARVVLNHIMGSGLDLTSKPKEKVVVTVGKGVCKFKFDPEIIERIFVQREQFGLEYTFTLVEGDDHSAGVGEAVDLPEWLIPIPVLKELAEEAGFELEEYENFHDFYQKRSDPNRFPSAHNALYNMKVLDRSGSISKEEWSVSRVYVAVKFTKVREAKTVLEDDEKDNEEAKKEQEPPLVNLTSVDISKKKKFLPLAMMKAKKAVGSKWETLSQEEKTRLTNIELEKM